MNRNIDPLAWGNRRHLLPKRMTYAFSMDINLALEAPFHPNVLAPVCWPPRPERLERRNGPGCSEADANTYRVPSVGEFVTSAGLRPDVPVAKLIHADDQIVLSNRLTGALQGRLLFETDTPDLLRMDYTGVVNFRGWPVKRAAKLADFKDVRGAAFVSSRQETGAPKYRWLVHNQLIGVGHISPATEREKDDLRTSRPSPPRKTGTSGAKRSKFRGLGMLLTFSFDFYLGS